MIVILEDLVMVVNVLQSEVSAPVTLELVVENVLTVYQDITGLVKAVAKVFYIVI